MSKVVLQLINDSGEVEDESTLIRGANDQEAQRVFDDAVHGMDRNAACSIELVVEFHYKDGDVGAYDDIAVQSLWAQFTKGHEASHILIRPANDEGQVLSNFIHAALA